MAHKKYGISMSAEVANQIETRIEHDGDRSPTIARQLERYFSLLERARRELRAILTEQEMSLIVDALNGTAFMDTFSLYFVNHEVSDAIDMDGLDTKWVANGDVLKTKMNSLNDVQRVALVDAVQRWWNRVAKGEQPDFRELLL